MEIKIVVPGIWLKAEVVFDEETKTFWLDPYCDFCEGERIRSWEDEYGMHIECLDCGRGQRETLQISVHTE